MAIMSYTSSQFKDSLSKNVCMAINKKIKPNTHT